MSDEYLWDRSGEPDPEIQRLEDVLSRLRAPQQTPEWRPHPKVRAIPVHGAWDARWRGAMAAGIALVLGASWLESSYERVRSETQNFNDDILQWHYQQAGSVRSANESIAAYLQLRSIRFCKKVAAHEAVLLGGGARTRRCVGNGMPDAGLL